MRRCSPSILGTNSRGAVWQGAGAAPRRFWTIAAVSGDLQGTQPPEWVLRKYCIIRELRDPHGAPTVVPPYPHATPTEAGPDWLGSFLVRSAGRRELPPAPRPLP